MEPEESKSRLADKLKKKEEKKKVAEKRLLDMFRANLVKIRANPKKSKLLKFLKGMMEMYEFEDNDGTLMEYKDLKKLDEIELMNLFEGIVDDSGIEKGL